MRRFLGGVQFASRAAVAGSSTHSWAWPLAVLGAYIGSRLAFYGAVFIGAAMLPLAPAWPGQIAVSPYAVLNIHWRWDALYYYAIALHGYAPSTSNAAISNEGLVAFFPLFPLLCRGMALLLAGGNALELERWLPLSGIVVANVALLLALALLYRLAYDQSGDRSVAERTVLYMAVFPLAWYYGVPYAESLLLACSLGMFVAARRRRWIAAGLCAALASATRPVGVLLGAALALEIMRAWRHSEPGDRWRALFGLAVAPSGLGLFMLYLWRTTGDGLAFAHAQNTVWQRATVFPLLTLWRAVELLLHPALSANADMYARSVLHTIIVLIFLVVLLCSVRCWPVSWTVYGLLLFMQLLSAPWPGATLMHAAGRSAMVFFPVYITLAQWSRRQMVCHLILMLCLPLFGLLAALYACWYFVG